MYTHTHTQPSALAASWSVTACHSNIAPLRHRTKQQRRLEVRGGREEGEEVMVGWGRWRAREREYHCLSLGFLLAPSLEESLSPWSSFSSNWLALAAAPYSPNSPHLSFMPLLRSPHFNFLLSLFFPPDQMLVRLASNLLLKTGGLCRR